MVNYILFAILCMKNLLKYYIYLQKCPIIKEKSPILKLTPLGLSYFYAKLNFI